LEAFNHSNQELFYYRAGSNGPEQSETLITNNGHQWYEE